MVIFCKRGILQSLKLYCSVNYWNNGSYAPNNLFIKTDSINVFLDKNGCLRIPKNTILNCKIDDSKTNCDDIFKLFGSDILDKSIAMILSGSKFELSEKDLIWKISPDSQEFNSSRFITFPNRNVTVSIHDRLNCEIWIVGMSLFEEKDIDLDEVEEDTLYPIWKDPKKSDQLELDL